MASIIHQATRPGGEEQAELAALTGNERSRNSSQRGGGRGGFLRQLFCCFTGNGAANRYNAEEEVVKDEVTSADTPTKVPPTHDEPRPDIVKIDVPSSTPLLGPLDGGKVCAVIDLDETLVHSSFKPIANADFRVPVEIEGVIHQVYVLKRPYVDEFLAKMGELFECVLFTASLAKYADEVANEIDPNMVFSTRLFRDSCVYDRGNYVKDLSKLGRELTRTIIIDNSPASYLFQPENAVPVSSWFEDKNDRLLLDIIPDMEQIAYSSSADFYNVVAGVQNRITQMCEGYQ